MSIDLLTLAVIVLIALGVLFVLDLLLAGGGMTSAMMGGMMHGGAAMMGSPYGWVFIVALVIVILVLFGLFFAQP
ncbi:MAG: hypothetical protein HY741_04430 [Chloroflexi bacterium]|nr:hypothetical protein [Chloroflexota bacterium]